MMKHILVLALLVCAAYSAPTEDENVKAAEAEDAPEEQVVAVAEAVEEAPVDTEVAAEAPVSEEVAPTDAHFNFCPSGWISHRSRCFLFVNSPKNWFDAEAYCNRLGGHLASATSPSEYRLMQYLTQRAGHTYAWMGGFYLQGKWLWIDRQGMHYQNWYNRVYGPSNSCMYLMTTHPWNNYPCTVLFRFICSNNPFDC